MKLLLDTHVLLWWLGDDSRLGREARVAIGDPQNTVLFSDASLWEIAIKCRTGKMTVDLAQVERDAVSGDLTRLAISATHFYVVLRLPDYHRDPFDHLLIAQAIAEDAILVTSDRIVPRYPVRTMGSG